MGDNVVEVVVRQRAEGSALRDAARDTDELKRKSMEAARAENPATVNRIKELYTVAANYETRATTAKKPAQRAGAADAAKDARAEARDLEKDLERFAKERYEHERGISREHRQRDTVARAQEAAQRTHEAAQESAQARRLAAMGRVGRAGANLAESAAGLSPFGGVTSALGSAGGPIGTAIALAAAIGTGLAAAFSEQRRAEKIIGFEDTSARTVQARSLQRLRGFEGSSGGAREVAESAKDDRIEREAQRAKLEEEARTRWYNPRSWLGALTGSNRNAITGNENAIQRDLEKEREARETQRAKFSQEGAREIQVASLRANAQYKEARAVEDQLTLYREKIRLQREGATVQEAEAGAGAKLANILRERSGSFARLITARDGAGDTARIATLAREQREAGIDLLRRDVNRNHHEAVNPKKNFFDRP